MNEEDADTNNVDKALTDLAITQLDSSDSDNEVALPERANPDTILGHELGHRIDFMDSCLVQSVAIYYLYIMFFPRKEGSYGVFFLGGGGGGGAMSC